MKQNIKILTFFTFALFALFSFVPKGSTQTKTETAGQKFKNVKVLSDMPADQLGKVMNLMAASLGVNCKFCHVSGNADFEKDDNEHKQIAREMIKITFELNKNHFDNRLEISCNTCHNGRSRPQSALNLNPVAAEERPKQPNVKPTVDRILDKYIAALGGKENLAKITSRYVKANRLEPDGKTTEPEEVWQKSNKLLVTTKYGDYLVSEGFDGKQAWKSGTSEISTVKTDAVKQTTGLFISSETTGIALKADEAEQIKRNAQLFASPNLKGIYPKMDFRLVDKIDGREVYLVTASTAENQRESLYFDVQTGLLVRRVASTPTVLGSFQYQVDYADYKDFGGVKLPVTTRFAVPNISWTRKILEVKNNALIDDVKFNQVQK